MNLLPDFRRYFRFNREISNTVRRGALNIYRRYFRINKLIIEDKMGLTIVILLLIYKLRVTYYVVLINKSINKLFDKYIRIKIFLIK